MAKIRFDLLGVFVKDYPLVGIMSRALTDGILEVHTHDIRNFGIGKHQQIDDYPFGGGAGMLMRVDVLSEALKSIPRSQKSLVVLPTPRGHQFTQKTAEKLSHYDQIIFVCGRYEGIDQRFIDSHVDIELSMGPYVISGGELAAHTFLEAIARNIPGVLGNQESLSEETHSTQIEYSQYTRPAEFEGLKVPEALTNGNHKEIEKWKKENSQKYQPKGKEYLND